MSRRSGGRPGLIFDEVPFLYDRYRPGYPAKAVADLVELAGLGLGSRVLEVGGGTGQLTIPLARAGLEVTTLEPGPRMAAYLVGKVAQLSGVTVVQARFEDAELPPGGFDAVVSATAFHWVDPNRRYILAARAVGPGGSIALLRNDHVLSEKSEPYYRFAAPIYDRLAHDLGPPYLPPTEADLTTPCDEIAASGAFDGVVERRYAWDQPYNASSLIGLLRTYSNHRAMPPALRREILEQIRHVVDDEFNGVFVDRYVTSLCIASRVATLM